MDAIYGLKTCDSCRKAKRGTGLALVDIRENPLTPAQIARFHGAFDDRLVNRASATWRGLDEAARGADPEALIAAHPAVMKRPVIEKDGVLHLGWGPDVRAALLG